MASRHASADKFRTRQGLNDAAVGYTASGSSEHSRHAAHGGRVEDKPERQTMTGVRPLTKRTRIELLQDNRRALAKVRKKLETETNPARIEVLKKSAEFKSYFIHKLENDK